MRNFAKDAQRIVLALLAGVVLYVVLWGGLPFGLGFLAGRFTKSDAKIVALRDTIRITDSIIVVRTETVTVVQRRVDTAKARSDALDSAVVILNDSTVHAKDSPDSMYVPPIVIADIRALRITVATQDTLIRSLYGRDSTQEWRIATRDKMIREYSQRHPFACGRMCGYVAGLLSAVAVYKAAR